MSNIKTIPFFIVVLLLTLPGVATEICGTYKRPEKNIDSNYPPFPATLTVAGVESLLRSVSGSGYIIPLNGDVEILLSKFKDGEKICVYGTPLVQFSPGTRWNYFIYDAKQDGAK